MKKKPVVIYGASGYTGRLIAEYLREYQIPFIAAGRNANRIEKAMSLVPGIETAEYDVVEVEHTVCALTKLFAGAQIVCNTVGPFLYYGEDVVEAALNAQCHYLDVTGEQQYLKNVRDKFSQRYKNRNKVLAPGTSYMFTVLDIAAHKVLETPGIDTLEAGCIATGVPTYSSTQTIFFSVFQTQACYLLNNQLTPWTTARGWEMPAPGKVNTQMAHPWGGGSLPIWFQHDPRVHTVRQLTTFSNRELIEYVISLQVEYTKNIQHLPQSEKELQLSKMGQEMQSGMPPRENRLLHRTMDFVYGYGTGIQKSCVIHSAVPYQLTGVVQAALANHLLQTPPQKTGFVSSCQAVGYQYMLGAIKHFIPIEITI